MPVRRTYDVETSNLEQMQPLLTKNQEYFKSYICMVLVTLIICLIFFLIALFIANNKNQNVNHGDIESESGFNALKFNRENSSILKTTLEHTSTTRKHYTTPISIIFINRTTSSLPISSSNDELSSSTTASSATNGSSTDQLHLSEKLHQHGTTITPTDIISTTPSDVITTDGIIDLGLREIHSTTPSDVITTGVVSDLSVKESHSTVTSDITTTDEVTDLRVREIHSTTLKDVIPTDGVTDLSEREILSTTPSDVTTTDVVTDLEVKTIHSTTSSDVITTDGVTDLGVLEIHSTTPSGATTTDVLKDLSIREILSTTQSDVITTDVVTDLEVKKIHSTTLSDVITTDGVTDLGVIIHSTTPSGETTDKVSLATTESTPKASSTTNSPIRRIESYLVSSDDSNSTALNTCTSKSCHSTASRLLNLIDKDVDKCYNFYDFACGQRHTVRSNEEMLQKFNYDVFKKSLDKINNSSDEGQKGFLQFYKSCIEHDPLMVASNLSQIYEIVKRNVYGFILNENDTILVDGMHISELISKMILLNHAPLFDVDFVLDESKTYIFKVMPPKFKILSTIMAKCKFEYESELRYSETLSDFYSQCVRSDVYKNIYIQHMDTILNVVKAFDDIQNATKKDELLKELKVSFEDYYEFYQKLPNILDLEYSERAQGISDCSENEKLYEATIEEWNTVFNERYDSVKIDWIYLFKNLVGKNITPDAKVQIYFKPFFNDLFEKKLTVKKMHNLLVATFIRDYYIELMLPDQQCLEKTIQLHPEVASNLYHDYLKRNISKLQDTVTNIFDNIKNTFNNTVFNNSIAFDLNMKQDMSTILNDIQLDFYKPFPKNAIVSEACDKYLDCFLRASKEFRQRKYLAWNQNIAESNYMWFHTARVYDMNPVTVYQAYKIAIPYGMFYGYNSNLEELPSYLLMSTIGRKLAYHLANYFSIIGLALLRQKFNKTISYLHDVDVSCATKESYKEYDNDILSCIINQYNEPQNLEIKSKPAFFDITVDYVLNQIISDGSAIRLAYDTAFSKRSDQKLPWITTEYTDEQLFYISAVQEFCDSNEDDLFTFSNKLYQDGMLPKQVRVFDFLKSDTIFASIFKCPNGTKYNPDGKCITFPYLVKPTPDPEDNEFVS